MSEKQYISKIAKGDNNLYIKDAEARQNISSHAGNTSNPHSVTKSQVGLGNVTNDAQVKRSEMGAASGVATLDSSGKVPASQLPSYVDDVLEYDTKPDFPATGEAGKIYVDKSTSTTWRWSGSTYTQIKGDLVIGTTTGTAADGGVANTHYNNTSNPHSVTKAQVGLGSVVNTGDSATPVSGGTTKFTTGGAYTELNKKVDKVSGKGLSTNDYTTDEKSKLAGIAAGAEVNVQSDWNATSGDAFIKNKPTIPDSFQWYGTSSTEADVVQKEVSIPSITSLKAGQLIIVLPTVTSTVADSTLKLNSFDAYPMRYGNAAITTSTDSIVWSANYPSVFVFDGSYWIFLAHGYDSNTTYSSMSVAEGTTGTSTKSRSIAAVNLKQIIQALAPQSDWNATSGDAVILNKPTIPTVNNGKFSIKGAGTEVASTTANASSASSVDIVAGDNVTITPDATNHNITIAASITRNVTGSAAWTAADVITTTNAASGNVIKASGKTITTTAPSSESEDTTVPTSKAVWSAIANGIATADAMVYKGTVAGGSTGDYGALTPEASKGETYKVTTAGKIDGIAVEIGDMLICNTDSTAAATSSNYSTIAANWDFIQTNIDGTVTGPASSTSGNLASYNGTTGKVIKDSGLTTTDVSDAVSKKHSHSTLTLSTAAQAYDGTHTLALPSSDPYTSARTPSSHTHGNIQNGGTLQTNDITIANGDKLVVTDSSDSNKVARTSVSFDGSTTTKALTQKGTFETFLQSHQDISGKQDKVAKLGSTTKPVYTSAAGTFAECSTYAGGTAVTLNGSSKAASTASFYAPTSAGTAGQVLISSGGTPNWKTGDIIHYATSVTGTAGSTTSGNYNRAQWTGTLDGITSLYTGLMAIVKIPVAGVKYGVTLNVNGLGEHPVVLNVNTIISTMYPVGCILPLIYDAEQVSSVYVSNTSTEYTGCWKIANYDSNTTYTPLKLGFCIGTCDTNAATKAKTVTMTSYALVAHGIVSIKFTEGISVASATLNINSTGTKAIYYKGAALAANVIEAGDIVTMQYNSQYHIIGIVRNSGIPKTDLSSEVQESLTKADETQLSTAYIGAGASASAVAVAANLKSNLRRGAKTSVTASSNNLWILTPSTYADPTVLMGGVEVPMTAQSNTTVSGVTYKVLKSSNQYTGTFSVSLI